MTSVRVLTNNPAKCAGLAAHGVCIAGRVPLPPAPMPENLRYLRTKRVRMGHLLDVLDDAADVADVAVRP